MQFHYDIMTNPLNNSEWAFPLFECIHISMFAMSVGTIALVDFRMLGLTLRKYTPAQLVKATSLWTLIGLVVVIITGMVIMTTDPLAYYYNPSFRLKILMLTIGIVFNYTIHRRVAMSNASPPVNAIVGAISLLIWISVPVFGIFYAFV